MKILVIGSKGFIGSHCVEYFSRKCDVWECDVVIDYDRPKYIFIEAVDSDFQDIFINHKFDVCINCSGAANVPFSLEKPYNDFMLNTVNVFKILEAIRRYNPECKYLNMSSAAVYGNPEELPIREHGSKVQPVSPYGLHKAMSESICEEFHRYWGIKTACIRIFSAYGPGLKKQLLWDIVQKVKNLPAIELFGTGNESRDFIYIDDLVRLIDCVVMKSDFSTEVINGANGEQIKISEIAEKVRAALNSDKPIIYKGQGRKGDPLNWKADITRAKSLGYKQGVTIDEGIKQYVTWLQESELL